ncbi:putative membrane protein YfcA [Peptoniphilus ivorii]|uniref:hypothetical protein n=1 Tax=Aedoeadaptatus ivorii TaxID=54006 RepID=UPI002788AC67|nr:hypothetical protein [Peptoniphilus ivorii]MDQ0508415.1 putative membrane protein YfcA [Peptoniphilus ivorii]
MIVFAVALAALLYCLWKDRSIATGMLIPILCLCAAYYGDLFDYFIPSVKTGALVALVLCVLLFLYLSHKEMRESKREYLKKRRITRQRSGGNEVVGAEEREKIIVKDMKNKEEKVLYVRKGKK